MSAADFNFQEYRILSCLTREMVPGVAAQFLYKGYEISMSTAFLPCACPVAVYRNDEFVHETETVEQAIRYVDEVILADAA